MSSYMWYMGLSPVALAREPPQEFWRLEKYSFSIHFCSWLPWRSFVLQLRTNPIVAWNLEVITSLPSLRGCAVIGMNTVSLGTFHSRGGLIWSSYNIVDKDNSLPEGNIGLFSPFRYSQRTLGSSFNYELCLKQNGIIIFQPDEILLEYLIN